MSTISEKITIKYVSIELTESQIENLAQLLDEATKASSENKKIIVLCQYKGGHFAQFQALTHGVSKAIQKALYEYLGEEVPE